ncbi:MAG: hypothetical protein QOD55_1805 [Solirubrobacteraceae bacterium]|jgi:hypothetical protein|nr:hypothetical protein [Solirubrobacteraceae bacterium]
MTTLTLDLFLDAAAPERDAEDRGVAARARRRGVPRHAGPPAAEGRGRRTLDELIVGVWEDLTAHHAAACPVCGAAMRPRYGSGPAPVGGRCTGCDSTLG